MLLDNYVGFTCDACGNVWEQDFQLMASGVQCPACGTLITDGPDLQVIVGDADFENGLYECYACGHTFSYAATPNENPDDVPNCTHCQSGDVGQIY